jgi:hypothetical protein
MRPLRGTRLSSLSTGLRSVSAWASITAPRQCSTLKAFHSDTPTGPWKVTRPVLGLHGVDEGRGVGKTAQELGIAADGRVVQQRQDAVAARPAGQRQDALHAGVGEHRVHVARALRVGAGQVAARARRLGASRTLKPSACSDSVAIS